MYDESSSSNSSSNEEEEQDALLMEMAFAPKVVLCVHINLEDVSKKVCEHLFR